MSVFVNYVRPSPATQQPEAAAPEKPLCDMTVKELQAVCRTEGVATSSRRKADLIATIEAHRG